MMTYQTAEVLMALGPRSLDYYPLMPLYDVELNESLRDIDLAVASSDI